MEEDFEPVFDSVPVSDTPTTGLQEPVTNNFEPVFDSEPVFDTPEPKPQGFIDSTYGIAEDNQTPEFKAKLATQLEIRRTKRMKIQATNAKLDAARVEAREYVNTAESELVEASFLDKGQNFWSFGSRNFTDSSLVGYAKKLEREQAGDGLDTNSQESRKLIIQALKDKGATNDDLRALSMGMSQEGKMKIDTLDVTSESFSKVAREVMGVEDSIANDVIGPVLSGLAETGVGLATVALDAADIGNTILGSKTMSEDIEEQRQYLETLRADMEARKIEYRERYNKSSAANATGKYGPIAIMAAYNPTSIVAMAGVEGTMAGVLARGEGYSKSQAAAQAMIAAVVTGAIVKVGNFAPKILSYLDGKLFKADGKQIISAGPRDIKTTVNVGDTPTPTVVTKKASRVTNLDELPANFRSEVDRLQKQNGWSDEMVVKMINGYAKGAESGAVNAQDLIRQMASKGRKSSEEITDLMLRDKDLQKVMKKEINMRTQNVLKHVKKKSPLGKIIYANSNKLSYEGTTSINWTTVYNEAQDAGIDVSSSIMRKLENNKHLYGDMDLGYHNTLRNVDDVIEKPSTFSLYKTLAADTARLHLKLWANKQMGIGALPSFNIVNRSVDLMEQTFLRTKINKKLQATVMQSIVDGPIRPSDLKKVLKQQNPRTTDEVINEVVEAAVDVSQASKRATLQNEKGDLTPTVDKDGNHVYDLEPSLNTEGLMGKTEATNPNMRSGHLDMAPSTSREVLLRPKIVKNSKEMGDIKSTKMVADDYGEYSLSIKDNNRYKELARENTYLREKIDGNIDADKNLRLAELKHQQINDRNPELQTEIDDITKSLTTPQSTQLVNKMTKISNGFKLLTDTTNADFLVYKRGGVTFTLNPKTNTMGADLSSVVPNSKQGYKGYSDMWDIAKKLGYDYKPGGLTKRNSNLLTHFMLKKASTGDTSHILIRENQLGGTGLGDLPLTSANADKLRKASIKEVETRLRSIQGNDEVLSKLEATAGGKRLLDLLKQHNKLSDMRTGSVDKKLILEGAILALAATSGIATLLTKDNE